MSPTILFTHLKIILLQCFQFSVSAIISSIQMDPILSLFYFIFLPKKKSLKKMLLVQVGSRVESGRVGLIHKKHWSGYESTCFCFGSKNRVWVRYFSGRVESIRLENSNPFCHVYKQLCTRFAVVQLKDLVPLSLSLSLVWVWLILSTCVSRERL